MKSYNFELQISPDGFRYATIEYHNFIVREVLKDKEPTGEFHVKLLDLSSHESAVDRFRSILPGCKVGLIDPEGILKLEYPIYLLIDNKLVLESFNEIMSNLDEELGTGVKYAGLRS